MALFEKTYVHSKGRDFALMGFNCRGHVTFVRCMQGSYVGKRHFVVFQCFYLVLNQRVVDFAHDVQAGACESWVAFAR